MAASSSKAKAHLRLLARARLRVSPGPGQPPREVAAIELVNAAERSLALEDFDTAARLGEQLRRTAGLVSEGLRLLLMANLALARPRQVRELTRQLADVGVADSRGALVLSQGLGFCNRPDEALGVIDKALRHSPADAMLRQQRGQLLAAVHDLDGAEAELRRALSLDSRLYAPYRQLAVISRLTPDDVARLESANVPDAGKADAWMALAAGYRKQGDRVREFAALARVHALLRLRDTWDPEEEHLMAQEIAAIFSREFLAGMPAVPAVTQRPIFVIGMPRSGSTLTEQILVSTGAVGTAGESQVFPWLLLDMNSRRHGGREYPAVAREMTAGDMVDLQQGYLRTISGAFTTEPVFVDKQFTNYKFVGILARLFPDARFVHTVRDPLDIILSTYQYAFPNLGFSHDLEHLARAWQDRTDLMKHWHKVLPGRVHALVYEDLVARPEPTLRELLAFCGLAWTDAALRFHETQRSVRTASLAQVRQPLYQSSVGRWRAYADLLEPARRVLQAASAAS